MKFMKFTPKAFKENVNVSNVSPLREFFVLVGAILGGLVLIYLVLGLALDILIERAPVRLENSVDTFFKHLYHLEQTPSAKEQRIQKLLDELVPFLPEENKNRNYTVRIAESPQANALALPGGQILLFSALLEEIESENELSMILAHELGHFINRDHLRGLGRGLVLVLISGLFFGTDSAVTNLSQRLMLTTELKFSRRQERAADLFALDLLNKRYGHSAGAYDFFERLDNKRDLPRFTNFLSTHPYPLDRVKVLKSQIKAKGYISKETAPF